MASEKSTRIKETMRMMGMSDASYWLSWYIYFFVVNLIIVLICWQLLITWVFTKSDPLIVLLYLWVWGQSVFSMIVFGQSLFDNPKTAALVTTIAYFGSSLLS